METILRMRMFERGKSPEEMIETIVRASDSHIQKELGDNFANVASTARLKCFYFFQ